jgi:hypothetical protein
MKGDFKRFLMSLSSKLLIKSRAWSDTSSPSGNDKVPICQLQHDGRNDIL